MRANIRIKYSDLEEICYYDDYERGVVCDDYKGTVDIDAEDTTFDRLDLETIVDQYIDDIIDILLSDKRYRSILLKKLKKLGLNNQGI